MKLGLMVLAAGLLATSAMATSTLAAEGGAAPGVSAKGEGRWEVLCHVVANGDPRTIILTADRSSYADARLTRSECDFHAAGRSDLVVSVTGAQACPFAGATADACVMTAPAGKGGRFKFQVAKPR